MFKLFGITTILLASGIVLGQTAAKLSEKFQKKLEFVDSVFEQAVAKAENAKFYAVQKANTDRLKMLKQALSDATKAGDFDAATSIKERVAKAEQAGGTRTKPKNVVKFGGHEYALIEEKATWHVAKRICEEMGGHLATINSADENTRLLELCGASKSEPWIGATDELTEGKWLWVDSSPVSVEIHQDNAGDVQHYLLFHAGLKTWDDSDAGVRRVFVCEWDS